MKNILDNLKNPDYRLLMYDDVVEMLLKGGASIELAQSLLFIMYLYYKDDFT
jgi:hypothetical protein